MAEPSATTPPYIPFKTLTNFLDRGKGTLPPKIDPTYLEKMSGSDRASFLASLKWLGLLNNDNTVTAKLVELVDQPEGRKDAIAELVNTHYKWLENLNTTNATMGHLNEAFAERKLSGATLRKAVRFYLHAATFAGISLSKNFKVRGVRAGAVTRGTARKTRRPRQTNGNEPVSTTSEDEKLRVEYVRMLMERAKAQEKPEPELLDRIEGLLYGKAPKV